MMNTKLAVSKTFCSIGKYISVPVESMVFRNSEGLELPIMRTLNRELKTFHLHSFLIEMTIHHSINLPSVCLLTNLLK